MTIFSAISISRLKTCHPDLQRIVTLVSKQTNIFVICGHRNEAEQNKALSEGKSQLQFPHSKHNSYPSMAVDICPMPLDWLNIEAFKGLAVIVKEVADKLGVKLEWGGDWKMKDYVHWQLKASEIIVEILPKNSPS